VIRYNRTCTFSQRPVLATLIWSGIVSIACGVPNPPDAFVSSTSCSVGSRGFEVSKTDTKPVLLAVKIKLRQWDMPLILSTRGR
jgi:hypothetical protein